MEMKLPLDGLNIWWTLALMVLGILIVGFFSSSEASLISVNKYKIRHLREKGDKKALAVERILKNHARLFSTILTLENLCIIFVSSLGTTLALYWFGSRGIFLATMVLTVFIVIAGEITPKTYAAQNAEKFALRVAKPMEFIMNLFTPVIVILIACANGLIKVFGRKLKAHSFLHKDEIKTVISLGEEEGVIASPERKMIEGVFDFAETLAKEVMVPRVEIVAVASDTSFEEVHKTIAIYGHSRLPVFEDNVDHIVGVIFAKDILQYLVGGKTSLTAREVMRPPFFAPGSKKIIELLSESRANKTSIVIILDEFGGTDGLITIETLLEEIVGEIEDEFDLAPPEIEEFKANEWLVDARISIEDANQSMHLSLPPGPYQTLGGFISSEMGKIPRRGDLFSFQGIDFIIEKVERYKLRKIRIVKH
jgi:putative hemolysin